MMIKLINHIHVITQHCILQHISLAQIIILDLPILTWKNLFIQVLSADLTYPRR
jgi:hypothetical protein